jgi:hypothetical protein
MIASGWEFCYRPARLAASHSEPFLFGPDGVLGLVA